MNDLAIRSVDDLARISQMVCSARLFDCSDPAQAGAKIMAGAELGLGPVSSMQNIIIVKGRPTLKASAWAGLIKRSGRYDYRYTEWTDRACTIEFTDNGEPVGVSTFTMEDARRAGLTGENWRKYPKAMLSARALTQGARAYCPDVSMGGIYTPDEIDDAVEVAVSDNPQPSADDGGSQEGDSGTDAAPSAEELYSDDDTFKQTIAGLVAKAALPDGYMARVCEGAGVSRLLELPAAKRVELIEELKGWK